MVNENLKLIENKKTIETVYELNEYKIPSFEEFMETYENDENLNYDDLSGDSVGSSKSYGKFYPSRFEKEYEKNFLEEKKRKKKD